MLLGAPARSGLKAAALWTGIELAIRGGLVVAVAFALLAGGVLDRGSMEGAYVGQALAWSLWLSAVILGWLFWRLARKQALTPTELGYRFDRGLLLVGMAAGLALAAATWGLSVLAEKVIPGLEAQGEELRQLILRAGPVAMVGVLIGNGLLGPAAEELAWRGYIQRHLVLGWGAWGGLLSTAMIFAAKHAIVDLSLLRLPILVAISIALGLLRMRWGTGVSTIAHAVLNSLATLLLLYSD